MSELDADLYGDLYGNDEPEFPSSAENGDQSKAEESLPSEAPPQAPVVSAVKAPPQTLSKQPSPVVPAAPIKIPATETYPVQTYEEYALANAQSGPPSYAAPATQQIPTYQQPQSDYAPDSGQHEGVDSYDRQHSHERSVRPSEMKDEGKMFIGGLNWDTTDESLRNYFSQFGKVDACTIMRDAAGRSRCFAFLTFEDPASVNAVMVREHFLDGKIIDPKRAIPRQEHQRATKLFIGGLAGSVTSESMRDFFSQFGKVIDSTVMLDRETGRSKGFGFVSFEDTNVQPFLGFGNLEIDGKLIDVKLAQPRYQRDNFNEDGGQQQYTNKGGNFNAAASPMPAAPSGNTPFDPQALAALYTRMFQMAGGGGMMAGMGMGMNPGMTPGINPGMMGGMGGYGGGGAGMGMGRGGMGSPAMAGGMGGGPGMGGGMGRGGQGMGGGGTPTGPASLGPNVPRGPRGAQGGPGGPGGLGVGPQRAGQRGQHSYHPYAR
ncbi:RNA-binding domain-containing protein [Suillus brevipes Sb2]|nr:RNA-binding domain-containing protein [Suillus brevipes Sb2]